MAVARRHVHEPAPPPAAWYPAFVGRDETPAGDEGGAASTALFAPPTLPEAWAREDAAAAEILVLHARPGGPAFGGEACACGGRWRYIVAGSAAHPIWRCLHCGGLFRDAQRLG